MKIDDENAVDEMKMDDEIEKAKIVTNMRYLRNFPWGKWIKMEIHNGQRGKMIKLAKKMDKNGNT